MKYPFTKDLDRHGIKNRRMRGSQRKLSASGFTFEVRPDETSPPFALTVPERSPHPVDAARGDTKL